MSLLSSCRFCLICQHSAQKHSLFTWRAWVLCKSTSRQLVVMKCLLVVHFLGYVLEPACSGEEMHSYRRRITGCYETGLKQFLGNSSMHIRDIRISNCNIVFTERLSGTVTRNYVCTRMLYFCRSLWIISCHCPHLTDFEYTSECFPATEKSLWCLAQGCPRIRALRVPPVCHRYSNTDEQRCRQTRQTYST